MLILGIDPGTATTGYAIVNVENGIVTPLTWGLVETDKTELIEKRLIEIYRKINHIIKINKPNVLAIEKIFFANNAKTAIRVGQAQGVMLYCAARNGVAIVEYAPATIKKIVTGSGRAKKAEIQKALRELFGKRIRSEKKKRTHFDNAADALAIAYCHAVTGGGVTKSG